MTAAENGTPPSRKSLVCFQTNLLPGMDMLTAFGVLAVTVMLVFYALEERSAVFVLAFAGASLAAAGYGFLQGAWPFGVVELVWSRISDLTAH